MKKKILLTTGLLLLFVSNQLLAQHPESTGFADVKGMNFINAGVGLGAYGLYGTGGLPLTASFEHGITKNISAGASVGFVQRKYMYDWKYTYFIFGVRGSYHFNEVLKISNPKIDVYGGTGLIYRHYKINYKDDTGYPYDYKTSGSAVDVDLHAGGRYLFNEHVGAYAELGYGISPLQVGLSFKF